jgi:hypothetical protein
MVAPDRVEHSTRNGSGRQDGIALHRNMGLDVLIWGFGIAVFGVLARRAFEMSSQQRWRATWAWSFVSFVPLGIASQVWVAMNNPAPAARWVVLGFAGAALGASAFIALGEIIRSTADAHTQQDTAQTQPREKPATGAEVQNQSPGGQPPIVNQGPGSAYSTGQRGGVTAGTVNIGPVPRRVPPDKVGVIRDKLIGSHITLDVVIAGGGESKQFAQDIINAITVPGVNITDILQFDWRFSP